MAIPQFFTLIGLAPCSQLGLVKMIESGLPLSVISALKEIGLTSKDLSEINISPRMLKRRRTSNARLSLKQSDRVARVALIISQAEDVFASRDKAVLWLRTPDDLLDGHTPLKLLITGTGARVVEGLLQRVSEGIFV